MKISIVSLLPVLSAVTGFAQINSVSSNLDFTLTYNGAYYNNGDDAGQDIEVLVGQPFETQSSSSSLAFSEGEYAFETQINGTSPDFENESDIQFQEGDQLFLSLTTSAMTSGPGTFDNGRLFLETFFSGNIYSDASVYETVTLQFAYDWAWAPTYIEHPSPAGVTLASLLLGYQALGDSGTETISPNFASISGLAPQDDPYNIGIGGGLVDGQPQQLDFSDTGLLDITFILDEENGDSYYSISFYTEVEAFTSMSDGPVVIPEPSTLWLGLIGALLPFARRRR